jgi:hypothetical protein
MGKKALTYSGGLIALYLAVRYATGTGSVLTAGANGGAKLVKTFQGR